MVGGVERIGSGGAILTQHRLGDGTTVKETGEFVGHTDAIGAILALVEDPERGALGAPSELAAVGHRVVHGGEAFTESVRIDAAVIEGIRDCIELAPLHNPHNLAGIRAARERLPAIPHVAVFDTAFHPALPYSLYRRTGGGKHAGPSADTG